MNPEHSLTERLMRLDTSVMSDVLDEAGLPNQSLAHFLRPLDPLKRLAGPALCATGRPIARGARKDASGAISMYELERRMSPGKVLVVDAGSEQVGATIGGFMAATFKAKGCHGLVVNGAVRDALELIDFGLPTFFRFHSPANASRRWELAEVDTPVAMPGMGGSMVIVHPGDFLLGDIDGLVVIPRRFAPQLIEDAQTLQRIEQAIRDAISAGATREEAFARNPRFAHVRPVVDDRGC
jgi:4-hydroxy-4-methyl-2-oxoglutarate aldolase